MRRLLVSLVLLSLAAPAMSQTAPGEAGRLSATRPDAGALGLRGADAFVSANAEAVPQRPGAAEPAAALDLRPLASGLGPPPLPSLPSLASLASLASLPAPPNPEQCRLQCAQTYYFCLAGDGSDECPQAWSQCRLGCDPRPGIGG